MGTIKVVMAEPGKTARITEIGTSLEELQTAVGGLIETCYPFDDTVCLVCNDEGKFNGMEPCRAVRNADGEVEDIICGPFFVCSSGTDHFASLSEEQLQKYLELFFYPEIFFKINGRIQAFPCKIV